MLKKIIIVFLLGFSSGLPLSLLSSTFQAWFSDAGLSIWMISSLSLITLPYIFRFLWAPFLDRYQILSLGKRRGWICVMQILIIIGLNAMTFFNPKVSPGIMIFLAFILAVFSATQDAAVDAHRVEYLPQNYYGLGASLATTGYRIGMLLSGGIALLIAQNFGWIMTYRLMSAILIVGVLAIFWSPEPTKIDSSHHGCLESFAAPIQDLISRPDILWFSAFILLFKLGEVFTTSVSGIVVPFLIQGLGFSLATIGYVNKIFGTIALIIGGIVGGGLMLRVNLYRALLYFGLLQAVTNLLFVCLALSGKNITILSIAVIADNFASGMGSIALVALIMRFVNLNYTATQFSILICIAGLPRVFSGPIGAYLHTQYGWIGLYTVAFFLSFLFIPFLYKIESNSSA